MPKITFRKAFDPVKPLHDFSPSSMIEDDIRLKRDENGNCVYVKVGEKDMQSYINSFAAGCSLIAMLEKCSFMPISEKIRYFSQKPDSVSFDTTILPKDGIEAFNVYKRYEHIVPDFTKRMRSGESFKSIMKSYQDSVKKQKAPKPVEEKEVIEDGKK